MCAMFCNLFKEITHLWRRLKELKFALFLPMCSKVHNNWQMIWLKYVAKVDCLV